MSQLTNLDRSELFHVEGGWIVEAGEVILRFGPMVAKAVRDGIVFEGVVKGNEAVKEWYDKEREETEKHNKEVKEEIDRLHLKYRPHQGGFQKVGSHYWG